MCNMALGRLNILFLLCFFFCPAALLNDMHVMCQEIIKGIKGHYKYLYVLYVVLYCTTSLLKWHIQLNARENKEFTVLFSQNNFSMQASEQMEQTVE